jgi:hypothetical protein
MAIIEGLNQSLEKVLRDYKEIMVVLEKRGTSVLRRRRTIPTSGENPYLLLRFYDTYTYYFIPAIY